MAEKGSIRVGDTVTHPWWPAGTTAKAIEVYPMQARAHYSRNRRPRAPRPEHLEIVVQLDRAVGGSYDVEGVTVQAEPDDHWMESGLEVVQPVAPEK